jgi:hypothetical protein
MAKLNSYFGLTYDSPYGDAMLAGRPIDDMVGEPAPTTPPPVITDPVATPAPPTDPSESGGFPPNPDPTSVDPIIRPRDRAGTPPVTSPVGGPPPPPPPAATGPLPGVGGARPDVPVSAAAPFRTPAFMQNRFIGGTGGERMGGAGTPLAGAGQSTLAGMDEEMLAEILRRAVMGGGGR